MPRNKLQAALKNNGGAIANVTPRYEKLTDEQMRLAAFEARDNQEGAITDKMANSNRRNTLLAEMGFDWFDIDNLKPNPNNSYTITDEDVNNLAGLIWNSKEVEPLILRETEDGIQIIDGAHASCSQRNTAMHGAWFLAGAISLELFPMNRPISLCTRAI